MEPIEFLAAAEELLKKTATREVDYRNAASRAYYGAFHTCKQLLEHYPPSESQRGTEHEKTIAELVNHQDKRFKTLGNMLKTSKDQRHRADYKLAEKFALQDAKRVILSVKKLLQESADIQKTKRGPPTST
jgi:uncharacterized protein (UPF0332 family)